MCNIHEFNSQTQNKMKYNTNYQYSPVHRRHEKNLCPRWVEIFFFFYVLYMQLIQIPPPPTYQKQKSHKNFQEKEVGLGENKNLKKNPTSLQ